MSLLSVIVPVLNEEKELPSFLAHLGPFSVREIICVDGGSEDRTGELLLGWSQGAGGDRRVVISSSRGRGSQMNEGAKHAAGEILLFLHVDSRLHPEGFHALLSAFSDPAVVGGAFRLKIDSPRLILRLISIVANLRSRFLNLPYGDQGYFVRREVFERLGGYRNIALMEDVDFIRRLNRAGRVVLLEETIKTSARRWHERGALCPSLKNIILLVFYFLGTAPEKLAEWYYD